MRGTQGMAGAVGKALGMALCCVALAGCPGKSGEGDAGSDAGPVDSGQPCDSPAGSCAPLTCSTGNEHHVGAYCTHGGRQCGAYMNGSLQCGIDLDPRGGDYCLLIGCTANSDCGSGACCNGDPSVSDTFACVPIGCVTDAGTCPPPPFPDAGSDGGADGGNGDSGTPDGGPADAGPCVPSPAGTCFPTPCSTGNAQHIGAYCTQGGTECNQYFLACAATLDSDPTETFCISLFCSQNSDCGASACCASGQADGGGTKACVPNGCFTNNVCPGP